MFRVPTSQPCIQCIAGGKYYYRGIEKAVSSLLISCNITSLDVLILHWPSTQMAYHYLKAACCNCGQIKELKIFGSFVNGLFWNT